MIVTESDNRVLPFSAITLRAMGFGPLALVSLLL